MKKFILKLSLMLALTLVALVPLNHMYQKTNRYNNQNYELSKYKTFPFDIEFANFGSSHGQLGFYYPEDGTVSFNFALSSQTPEYDLALLKDNLKHFKEGATIVFPISYFTPYLLSSEKDSEFESRNQRYYSILNPQLIIDFEWTKMINTIFQPLNGRNTLDYGALLKDDVLLVELDNSYGNFPLENWEFDNSKNGMHLFDEAEVRWRYWKEYKANLALEQVGTVNPEIVKIYQAIVDISKENNLNPVFVTLPVTSELNIFADYDFYPIFVEDMKVMMEEIGNPLYIDYSHNQKFKGNLKYFIDTDHLSKAGAIEFTQLLKKDIQDLNQY